MLVLCLLMLCLLVLSSQQSLFALITKGCRIRRIAEPKLVFRRVKHPAVQNDPGASPTQRGRALAGNISELVCTELADIEDYIDPDAPMALLKAAVICCGVIETKFNMNLNKLPSLADQLMLRIGSGLEIESWSMLPVGSGMGGSSILGSALLYSLGKCTGMGVHTTAKCLIHDVIRLEKLSNDDCGWQDQAGGAVPGAKCISSPNSLPLDAQLEQYSLSPEQLKQLEQRIVLVSGPFDCLLRPPSLAVYPS
jgi:hypothetical protein